MSEKVTNTAGKPGKRRWRVVVVLGALVVAVAVVMFWPEPKEPEYQGKKLSEWLMVYGGAVSDEGDAAQTELAREAIDSIGTNALPCLLKWISYEPSLWRCRLDLSIHKIPAWIGDGWIAHRLLLDDRGARAVGAITAFQLLGEKGTAAVPELSRLLDDENKSNAVWRAAYALASVGKSGLPSLLKALGDPRHRHRSVCASTIGQMSYLGTNASHAVPALIRCLNDPDSDLAREAAVSLGHLQLKPEIVVPALADSLKHPDWMVQIHSVASLAEFGDKARSAVPALIRGLTDSSDVVRGVTTNALLKIAPEVLTNGVNHFGTEQR